MVVICPKCKIKLKVPDEKIAAAGTRFKCPKCSTVLLVKRPAPQARILHKDKILVAHEDTRVIEKLSEALSSAGFSVIAAKDGIEAMVNATKDLPSFAILSVSLPKIYGFEVCRRIKLRPETKEMKIILVTSVYDKRRYRREPESLYEADDYIEEHDIKEKILEKIYALRAMPKKEVLEKPAEEKLPVDAPPSIKETEKVEQGKTHELSAPSIPHEIQEKIERAKRLARTIVSDIYLYNKAKCDNSIKSDSFYKVFESELKESYKLYEKRISSEIRQLGDFFNEEIDNFLHKRKGEIQ